MTVRDLLELALEDAELRGLSSARNQRYGARALCAALGSLPAERLSERQIEAFSRAQREAGRAPSTINGQLSTLSRAIRLAVRRGLLPRRLEIERLPCCNARSGFLQPEEFGRLWAALEVLDADIADLVRWLYLTGWRVGESRRLLWQDVDLARLTVELSGRRTKNRRPRRIRLPRELAFLLERRDRARSGPLVFHRGGRPIVDFRGVWRRAAAAIGRPELLVHDLRRSFARNALEAGVPQRVAMELGGWRTASVFHRYAIVDEGQISRALGRVYSFVISGLTS